MKLRISKKITLVLFCGLLGCLCFGVGDWLMLYGDTTYSGTISWLTQGAAQIAPWRNNLAMALAFPGILLYGIALFAIGRLINGEGRQRVYRYLTAFSMTPSGRDVWFPYYPLCTDHCVKEPFEMAYETYRQMLQEYAPEDIALIGFSSGAALALGVCLHNNAQPEPLPMPGLIIASSPGCVPFSDEERQRMAELSPKDILVDAVFMTTIREIMEHGEQVPNYMLSGVQGDFTNFPMTHFYYGSNEVLYAEAPYFANAFEKYSAPCVFHIGQGLCHCYPSFDFYPEGKQAQEEIIGLLRKRE